MSTVHIIPISDAYRENWGKIFSRKGSEEVAKKKKGKGCK